MCTFAAKLDLQQLVLPAGRGLVPPLLRPPTSREQSRKPSIRPGGCSEAALRSASSGVPA